MNDFDILDLIPQRRPMVMIDRLVSCDASDTVTRFTVRPDCILVDSGELTAEGMLENIAQTCAARIGYLNRQAGHTVKLGFIGAVKSFELTRRPEVGETIDTRIEVKEEIFGITLVDAHMSIAGDTIATTTMKIALSDIEATQ